ncbi:DMT family transporter [Anaeromyxobacter paludicola]|uniref:Transporter n=1 Tax=Anaeromyxobacter paludicola TaxID=2918171 RepID=A0ABM7XD00_9BACT|nr:DMT family transporter [Anaeromyxobacter paludicola]BDG09745.1 transporter [Anaeromyxobacter paludicola]
MADLALLVLTLFWGTTFLLVHDTVAHTPAGLFLFLRFGLAALALGAAALWRRDRPTPGLVRHGLLLGAFLLAGFVFQTFGLRYTTPARSGFLTGLAVLAVPFLGRLLLGRKVQLASWIGVAFAVAGLLLLTRPWEGAPAGDVRLGDALTVLCSIAFALQIVYTSEWTRRHSVVLLTLIQVGVTFAGTGALALLEPGPARVAPGGWPVIAFTGLAMTALAFFVMNWAQRHTTAVRAALIFALEPVAAALFSHYWGGEPLGPLDWAGGGLIVLGVVAGEVGGAVLAARAPGSELSAS